MAKTRQQKEAEVQKFIDGLKGAKATVFADLSTLKVNASSSLRRKAEKESVDIATAKKTLLRLAFKEAGIDNVDPKSLPGSVSMLLGSGDEIAPAKIIEAFRKENEGVKILGGILESKWLSADEIKALALLPSRQEMLAKLVGTLNAPVSGFVNVLAGNLRGLVTALGAIKDAKSA